MIQTVPYRSHKRKITDKTVLCLDARFGFKDISFVNPKIITANGGAVIKEIAGRRAYYFDGVDDYLSIPDADIWNFTDQTTVEMWAYFENNSGAVKPLIAHNGYNSSANGGGWNIDFYTQDAIRFQFFDASGGVKYAVSSAAVLVLSGWYHIAVTRLGNIVNIFINGTLSGTSSSFVDYYPANTGLTIGAMWLDGSISQFGKGYFDQIHITKGIARYTGNFTPKWRE